MVPIPVDVDALVPSRKLREGVPTSLGTPDLVKLQGIVG
jgi:hypothetical protein